MPLARPVDARLGAARARVADVLGGLDVAAPPAEGSAVAADAVPSQHRNTVNDAMPITSAESTIL